MKKVLIITYYWPPSGGAGVQRWLKFVKYLPELGWQPIILTVDPAQASYPLTDHSFLKDIPSSVAVITTPTNEYYNLYKKIFRKKNIPYAGFTSEKEKESLIQKIVRFVRGNFFIPDPRKGWNSFAIEKATQIIKEQNIKIVISTSPPHSSQLIGLELKKKLNIIWIADLRDPWVDIYYYEKLMRTRLARGIDKWYESNVLNHADYIITVGDALKNNFQKKGKSGNDDKYQVIHNGFDPEDFLQTVKESDDSEAFTVTYIGTISNDYQIDGFVEATKQLIEEVRTKKIRFLFIGNITEYYKKILELNLGQHFSYVSHIPHSEVHTYLKKSNLLLLLIPNVKNNEEILTGKLFEYLASKKTILGIGPIKGDASKIIDECEAGSMFDYNDVILMKEFMKDLIVNRKNGCNENKVNLYSRKELTKKLVLLLDKITYQ